MGGEYYTMPMACSVPTVYFLHINKKKTNPNPNPKTNWFPFQMCDYT